MVNLHQKLWKDSKVQGYFSTGIKAQVWERTLRGSENMRRKR